MSLCVVALSKAWLVQLVLEVAPRVAEGLRIYVGLWLPSSMVMPKSASRPGLGLNFRCASSTLAVLLPPSLEPLPELKGL